MMTNNMQGWAYLGGKTWAEVTRDERFFCQHLYNLIRQHGAASFVARLNELTGLNLPIDTPWEAGFEVCFYRDHWHLHERTHDLHSPKRTFDLCLFSHQHIVIIEAKAQQGFDQDPGQLESFRQDRIQVKALCEVDDVRVVALASSAYLNEPRSAQVDGTFDGRPMSWKDMAALYGNDPVLQRADEIYEKPDSGGRNNEGKLTGEQLLARTALEPMLYVGRSGGLTGALMRADIASGQWRMQRYETSTMRPALSNKNWFSVAEFVEAVSLQQLSNC
ncbi:hypothetical protein LNV47_01480 [Paucibacter sp. DJ4R-1]|nr:hypothetical protein [Paucibacter sp. DJ4R-1]